MGNLDCRNESQGKSDIKYNFSLDTHQNLNININNIKKLEEDLLKVSKTQNFTFEKEKNDENNNNNKNNNKSKSNIKSNSNSKSNSNKSNNSNNSSGQSKSNSNSSSNEMILSSKEINSIPTPSSESDESKKNKI